MSLYDDLMQPTMLEDDLEQCASKYNLQDGVRVFRVGYGHSQYTKKEVRVELKRLKARQL